MTTYETEIIYHHVVVRVDRFGFGWVQRLRRRHHASCDYECSSGDPAGDSASYELTGLDVATLRRCQQGTGKSYGPVSIPSINHEPDFIRIRLFLVLEKA